MHRALKVSERKASCAALTLALTLAQETARGQTSPACVPLTDGGAQPTVVIAGPDPDRDDPAPFAITQALAAAAQSSLTSFVYVKMASADALSAISTQTPLGGTGLLFRGGNTAAPCTFADPTGAGAQVPDMAISEVYPATLNPNPLDSAASDLTLFDFIGPVQAWAFAVAKSSIETSISADAAYTIFGWGGAPPYAVPPWTSTNDLLVPGTSSGAALVGGAAIGLAPSLWKISAAGVGAAFSLSTSAITDFVKTPSPNATLALMPLSQAESDPTDVRVLAYQHTGQLCGYLPNSDVTRGYLPSSDVTTRDRINVRQGRYALWAPLHFVTRVDDPALQDAMAQDDPYGALSAMVHVLQALGPVPPSLSETDMGVDAGLLDPSPVFTAEVQAGLVPWCAMQVTRSGATDFGPEASWASPAPCGCAFESQLGAPLAGRCNTCSSSADCPSSTPQCRFGYCEVQ